MSAFLTRLKIIFRFINQHPLARKHKSRAYYNFIRLQLYQLLFSHGKIVPFVGETKLFIKKGQAGATGNVYTGLHDFNDMAFLLHYLDEEDLFYDIGANVGVYSILAAGCKRSRVVAFEPVRDTFFSLKKNVSLNSVDELVTSLNVGVGSGPGVVKFTSELDAMNHVAIGDEINVNKLEEVPLTSVDAISRIHGIPATVKIDVEGFETEVINGMQETLRSQALKIIIIELNGSAVRYNADENFIHETLTASGFYPYNYNPFTRGLSSLSSFGKFNTIYIRDIKNAEQKVKRAAAIRVFGELF